MLRKASLTTAIVGALALAAVPFTAGIAAAQEPPSAPAPSDSMSKDSMSKDSMSKGSMSKSGGMKKKGHMKKKMKKM